MDPKIALKCFN